MTAAAVQWIEFADRDALSAAAAREILSAAAAAIAARGAFHIVLTGGETPRALYARLATAEADWTRWQVYFGDERCLPAGDPARNDAMAREAWLDRVGIPACNVHPIPAELGPGDGAKRYAAALAQVPDFDLVLLGLGEDGHTASLFPGKPARGADVLPVHDAPKPPATRVTLSAPRLSRARRVLFLVSGASKRAAVHRWREGADIPARAITPPGGVEVLLDAAACDQG